MISYPKANSDLSRVIWTTKPRINNFNNSDYPILLLNEVCIANSDSGSDSGSMQHIGKLLVRRRRLHNFKGLPVWLLLGRCLQYKRQLWCKTGGDRSYCSLHTRGFVSDCLYLAACILLQAEVLANPRRS